MSSTKGKILIIVALLATASYLLNSFPVGSVIIFGITIIIIISFWLVEITDEN